MDFIPLFVTGTFRSATTLMAKALSANDKILVVDDPFFQFFKEYRNEFCHINGSDDFDDNYPVSDNFYSDYLDINRKMRNSNFLIPFKSRTLEEVKNKIKPFCNFYCPEMVPSLDNAKGDNFKELFENLLNISKNTYGSKETKFVGCKNTFCEQFISPLINTYPNIKIIHMMRDPRAVIASQNKTKLGSYPVLFVLRQWRKSVAYALENMHKKDNFLLVQYEKFVENPKEETNKICDFLNIEYDPKMVDATSYKGKKGQKWEQNSSFGTSREISKKFVEKWKEVLNSDEIRFIEDLCENEMKIFSYDRITENNISKTVSNPPKFKLEIQEWVKPYEKEFNTNKEEMNKEMQRYSILNSNEEFDSDFLERVFIVEDFLSKIKSSPDF